MRIPQLLDAKQKSSLLNSLDSRQIRRLHFKFPRRIPSYRSLEKGKNVPHFQNLTSASKKKKPLSRRGNHALIAAILQLFIVYCTMRINNQL